MTLPWFIRAIVASAGIFLEILFFLLFFCFVYALRLGKVGCQLYARGRAKRLIEIVVYQVYARNYGKWLIEIEGYQVYARKFGFFCSLEKIEDDGLTVKTQ